MYILLSERIPFTGEDDDENKNNIIKGEYDLKSPPFDKISDNALDLLKKLLNKDAIKDLVLKKH